MVVLYPQLTYVCFVVWSWLTPIVTNRADRAQCTKATSTVATTWVSSRPIGTIHTS